MTAEKMTTEEMIEVMQAYVAGKEIQMQVFSSEGQIWQAVVTPKWDWRNNKYRIKPEPRVIYLPKFSGGFGNHAPYDSELACEHAHSGERDYEGAVKFIEAV